MTNFQAKLFNFHGGYLTYGPKGQFVARFKYKPRGNASAYKRFLIKNFTTEEYFARNAAGEAPLTILESKGFISPQVAAMLKREGYPITKDGYEAYRTNRRLSWANAHRIADDHTIEVMQIEGQAIRALAEKHAH